MPDDPIPVTELCRRATGESGADGLRAIVALRARLEELEGEHVSTMLGEGASWAAIAEALGISRQAAHRRFRHRPRTRHRTPERAEVNRILVTGSARSIVQLARQEATALGSAIVGTEHLLLALAQAPAPLVVHALNRVGVDERKLREAIQPTIAAPAQAVADDERFTGNAREVLEGALREAVQRREGYIGVEHLLLALLRNPSGGAALTLQALGVGPEAVAAGIPSGV